MNLVTSWIETPVVGALGWTLVHSLWEGAIVALLLAAGLSLLRGPRARYAASCFALLMLLAVFSYTFVQALPGGGAKPSKLVGVGIIPPAVRPLDTGRNLAAQAEANSLPWLVPLWMIGVVCFQVRGLAGWLGARRLRKAGVCAAPDMWRTRLDHLAQTSRISRPVMLLESCLVEVPVLIGYLRPVILIPVGLLAGLSPSQVESILLHELAHIRRHDYLVNLFQVLMESLLFYHPAVWWITRVIRDERENCCDDAVVAIHSDAYDYASALAALEERRAGEGTTALASTGGNLMKRIRRLLAQPEGPRAGLTPVFSALLLTVTLVGGLVAWQGTPSAHIPPPYDRWVNEDVAYIITGDERTAFERLLTDAERDHFIEQFWQRRDPTPDTAENEFKQEHYRRIRYVNERFATSQVKGWKTDRGRIYILYGPPDEIESHPSGGLYVKESPEGGSTMTTFPFERWRYRQIEGVGRDVIMEFVDRTSTGDYHMTTDPDEKNALRYMPGADGQQPKAGATVEASGNAGARLSISLARYGDHLVEIYTQVLTKDQKVVRMASNMVRGQPVYTLVLSLAPGSYVMKVAVKDMTTGKLATEEIEFEAK